MMMAFATVNAGLHLWLNGGAGNNVAVDGAAHPHDRPSLNPSLILAADAPDSPAAEPMALILRRHVGRSATFGAVFYPHSRPPGGPAGGHPDVSAVSWPRRASQAGPTISAETLTCQVTTRWGSERWEISLHGRETPPLLVVTAGGQGNRVARVAGRPHLNTEK
jgi:hypothetical protein